MWNVELTQSSAEDAALGSDCPSWETWLTKTAPKTSRSTPVMTSMPSMVSPVASPRFIPLPTIHSTGGSMAMDTSQASSRMNRNELVAENAHIAMPSSTMSSRMISPVRRALEGVIAIHCGWPCPPAADSRTSRGAPWLPARLPAWVSLCRPGGRCRAGTCVVGSVSLTQRAYGARRATASRLPQGQRVALGCQRLTACRGAG